MAVSQSASRDETEDWLIPPAKRPSTVAELESRIETALVTARAAESAALEIGDAALRAADQAQRAADMAERAARAAEVRSEVPETGAPALRETFCDERLQVFSERASRVSTRLVALANPAAARPSARPGSGRVPSRRQAAAL